MDEIIIRKGEEKDLEGVFALIKELALFEKAPDEVTNTVERMRKEGFGDQSHFAFLVAEEGDSIVGISLYYYRYSTWKGKCLYLEDLIVTENYRNRGIGKKLFDKTLEIAEAQDCSHMSWQVLDWNVDAIRFYEQFDTTFDGEWINCKLNIR